MPVYPVGMTQKPAVTPFFDAGTNTISYVVRDPASNACAVMDFDYAAGRIGFKSVDKIIAWSTCSKKPRRKRFCRLSAMLEWLCGFVRLRGRGFPMVPGLMVGPTCQLLAVGSYQILIRPPHGRPRGALLLGLHRQGRPEC